MPVASPRRDLKPRGDVAASSPSRNLKPSTNQIAISVVADVTHHRARRQKNLLPLEKRAIVMKTIG
jgi:hypothetical protein